MDYDGGFIMQKAVDWSLLHPHHIDYFTCSQNNDSTNISIISPNYHRIIHKNVFDMPNDQSAL